MENFYTTRQIQDLLKVDRLTVYRMLHDGRLHGVKIGAQWRFARTDVENLLMTGTRNESESGPLPIHCIQPFLNVIAGLIKTGILILDDQGETITQICHPGSFCATLQENSAGRAACRKYWKQMEKPLQPKQVLCHAGMAYAIAPIRQNYQLSAMLLTGPYHSKSMKSEQIERLGHDFEMEPSRLQTRAWETPEFHSKALQLAQQVADAVESLLLERATLANKLQRIAEITSM